MVDKNLIGSINSKVNILIATRNRAEDLKRMLDSLITQTNNNFSVTIVDSSDKGVNEVKYVVDKFSKRLDIQYVHSIKRGSCTQRNLGISLIEDNYILISDDDCIYEVDAISQIYKYIEVHPQIALFGLNIFEERGKFYLLSGLIKQFFGTSNISNNYIVRRNGINAMGNNSNEQLAIEWLPSCSLVLVKSNIRHKDLINFNLEFERFSGYASAEDVYLTHNLYLHGYKLGLAKQAKVKHVPSKRARDNEEIMIQVRTYNRSLIWNKLVYKQRKISVLPFLLSNVFFVIQYSLKLITLNPKPLKGHIKGLMFAYRRYRND